MIKRWRNDEEISSLSKLPHLYDEEVYTTYQDLKTGKTTDEISPELALELDMLYLIEKLGYDVNTTGTYLLKDMAVEAVKKMLKAKNNDDICEIRRQMKQAFSQFYVDLARNDRDMGIKTFYTFVNIAHENKSNAKKDIARKMGIISGSEEPEDQAFKAALYYIKEKALGNSVFVTRKMLRPKEVKESKKAPVLVKA